MGEQFARRSVVGGMALEAANLLFFRALEPLRSSGQRRVCRRWGKRIEITTQDYLA